MGRSRLAFVAKERDLGWRSGLGYGGNGDSYGRGRGVGVGEQKTDGDHREGLTRRPERGEQRAFDCKRRKRKISGVKNVEYTVVIKNKQEVFRMLGLIREAEYPTRLTNDVFAGWWLRNVDGGNWSALPSSAPKGLNRARF